MIQTDLTNQLAVVTGAGRGIGRAIAIDLAKNGALIVAAARTRAEIENTAENIVQSGGSALPFSCDLARESDLQDLFAFVDQQPQLFTIMVNNAGVGRYGLFHETPTQDLQALLDINVRGTYICCREALQRMIPHQKGTIINISSVVGIKGYPNQSAYTASKHAVVGMTKSLAVEAQPHGIRVSVIHPGGVDTDLVREARPDLDPDILMRPEDIAHTVMYLLSLSDHCAVDEIYIRRRGSKPF